VLNRRCVGQRHIGGGLEGYGRAAAPTAVSGDQHLGRRVDDPVAQGVRGKATKHHRVGCPDAGAGEHGHGELGDHGHVDADAIAGLHPETPQYVGEAGNFVQQLRIRDGPRVTRLTFPVVGDAIAASGGDVAVEAVGADIEPAPHEPLGEGELPLTHGIPGMVPIEGGGLVGPEPLPVSGRGVVQGRVGDECVAAEVLRRWEATLFEIPVLDGWAARTRVARHGTPPRWLGAGTYQGVRFTVRRAGSRPEVNSASPGPRRRGCGTGSRRRARATSSRCTGCRSGHGPRWTNPRAARGSGTSR